MEIKIGDIVLCEFYFSDLKQYKKRPVLIFKDNLPFEDFMVIAISSKSNKLYDDEYILDNEMLELGSIPKKSKFMLRKTFLIDKKLIIKLYGNLTDNAYIEIKNKFCLYHGCN